MQTPEQIAIERRRRRTEDRARALELLLNAVRVQHHFDLLLIADSDGLLMAGSGNGEDLEALAAYAPLLHRTPHGRARASILTTLSAHVPGATADGLHVRLVRVDDTELFLCAAGPRDSRTEAGLYRAQNGVLRIYR